MSKKDTAEYSSSKAPETRPAAEERDAEKKDSRLIPGGAHASPTQQGMAALHRGDLPSEARDPKLTSYGDSGRPETK